MAFTALLTTICEVREGATAGVGGQTSLYRTLRTRAEACDRQNVQEQIVSASVSALSIALSPLGIDAVVASNLLFLLYATQPIDVQFGASGATLSAVRTLTGALTCSALFVTTGTNATRIVTGVFGGSGATITATL